MPNDEFELWDLRIEVTGNPQDMVCVIRKCVLISSFFNR